MNKNYIIGGIIIIVIVVGGAIFYVNSQKNSVPTMVVNSNSSPLPDISTTTTDQNTPSVSNSASSSPVSSIGVGLNLPPLMQSTLTLFAATTDYQNAYRIYPTFNSAKAKQAISGYTLKVDSLGNNEFRVNLIGKTSAAPNQFFIVSGDQKVYFVERSFGDDSTNSDELAGDDKAVAVDSKGYILQ
jgi:hypothetical protein